MIKRGDLSAPLNVFLDLTNRCNLQCRHCLATAGKKLDNELTTEEWLALIQRLGELKVFKVTVTGGEPLLHPEVFRLLGELDSLGIVMRLNTNATLVDDEVAERLASLKWLRSLNVSLDGSSAAVHDQLRGPGAFDRALPGIKALVRHGLRVGATAVVSKLNAHDLEGVARLAQELGLSHIALNNLSPGGRTAENWQTLWLSSAERQAVAERITGLYDELGTFVGSNFLSWHRTHSQPPRPGTNPSQIHYCGAALESCTVRADGGVGVCNGAPDYVCGNVRESDLVDIWRDSPQMRHVRALPQLTADDVEGCRDCPYRFQCSTGCRADSWSMTGSWTGGPASICWYRPN
jgi:SynChlorMet cassette radical SAM/SPASM protein ScmE